MRKTAKPHRYFLIAAFALTLFGIVLLTNISIPISQQNFGESYYYLRHQFLFGFLGGMILFFVFRKMSPAFIRALALPLFIAGLVLLALVHVPGLGYEAGGARRGLVLAGLSFQPAEFAKLALVVYLAAWLEKHRRKIKKSSSIPAFILITGSIAGLIVAQPDLGTTALISAMGVIMYLVAGAKIRAVAAILLLLILLGGIFLWSHPYSRDRLFSFFSPQDSDVQGRQYQLRQALIAIGSGGILGRGLGQSIQKYHYLPEAMGDSVFAIIGEELGFVGAAAVVLLFIVFVVAGIKIAMLAKGRFETLVVIGVVSWIGTQAFLNIGGIVQIIPFTGIPLPFISYGGSALALELAAVGIISSIARH